MDLQDRMRVLREIREAVGAARADMLNREGMATADRLPTVAADLVEVLDRAERQLFTAWTVGYSDLPPSRES